MVLHSSLVLALSAAVHGLTAAPVFHGRAIVTSPRAAPALVLRPETHKKHALQKKAEDREEAARAQRAAEQSRLLLQAEQRSVLREHISSGQMREAGLQLQSMARAGLLPDPASYVAALDAFTAPPRTEHKLVAQLGSLLRAHPVPLWPGAAEAFLASTAAQGSWQESLGWWKEVLATSGNEGATEGATAGATTGAEEGAASSVAPAVSEAARATALLAMVRLGQWADAEALLAASPPSACGSRLLLGACTRAAGDAGAPAAMARRTVERAVAAGIADEGMLRDALVSSASCREFSQGLELLRATRKAAARAGDVAGLRHFALDEAAATEARARLDVLRVSAVLHAGIHEPREALAALRRARLLASRLRVDGGTGVASTGATSTGADATGTGTDAEEGAGAAAAAAAAPGGGGLGLAPVDLEAIALACARSEQWGGVRWLLRATTEQQAPAAVALTLPTAIVALAACAHVGGGESADLLSGSRAVPFATRRLRLARVAAECAAAAEHRAAAIPTAAEGKRGRAGAAAAAASGAPAGVERQWASAALWARLQAVLRGGAGEPSPAAERVAAERAAAEAVRLLSSERVAGLNVSAEATECVLCAAAPCASLQEDVCALYAQLLARSREGHGEPPPSAEICRLVLPPLERAGRWKEALALPHASPSAECFSRGIELECDIDTWLRVAEARSNARRLERRAAAIGRWRGEVMGAAGAMGAAEAMDAAEAGGSRAAAEARLREALRSVLQLRAASPAEAAQQERFEVQIADALRRGPTAAMVDGLPRGVASKIAYQQVGQEALRRADALVRRAQQRSPPLQLDGGAYSALVVAHAAMRDEPVASHLALDACRAGVALDARAYLAALASVRTPSALHALVRGMGASSRFRGWLRTYSDAPVSSILAIAGALGGKGRAVAALQRATGEEVHAALQALAMIESGAGGVSALLQDLRASGVAVGSPTRCMLLSTAMLEGWVQQQLALNVWLPLLSEEGEAALELLGGASLQFVETPPESGFKGAWCFDWRGPNTHPILVEWMRHRAASDPRFALESAHAGLCPVDLGVHVLEGVLLALRHRSQPPPRRAAADGGGREAAAEGGGGGSGGGGGAWGKQLAQLREALQGLIVQYEAASLERQVRFSDASRTVTAPALSSQRGVLRELLAVMELQHGIRYGAQLQTAKVFVVAVEQLLAQLAPAAAAPPSAAAPPPSAAARYGRAAAGRGLASSARPNKAAKGPKASRGKRAARQPGLTKRERKAFDELARGGLVGLGAVDPSPQRTTVAVAACISLLLL